MKAKTEALNIRITPDTLNQLNELCKMWDLSKTQCIERLIYGEYLKSTEIGNERLQEVIKAFNIIQKQAEVISNGK